MDYMSIRQPRKLWLLFLGAHLTCCLCSPSAARHGYSFMQKSPAGDSPASSMVEGMVRLDGKEFRAVCNCNSGAMSAEEIEFMKHASVCNPSEVNIQKLQDAEGLTVDQVRDSYGQPADVTFGKASEQCLVSLDDRIMEPSVGTPGGDLGEFVLAMSVLQEYGGSVKLTEEYFTNSLDQYLSTFCRNRKFYHSTDYEAVSNMEKSLLTEGLNLVEPPPVQQAQIKAALGQARNVGDLHFRNMLEDPKSYHIDPEIPRLAMVAFYNILWDKTNPNSSKLWLDILSGKHNAQAFLEVTTSRECVEGDEVPLLKPNSGGVSVLICNVTGTASHRKDWAKFATTASMLPFTEEQFVSRMDRFGYTNLEMSASRMARHLPFYHVAYV